MRAQHHPCWQRDLSQGERTIKKPEAPHPREEIDSHFRRGELDLEQLEQKIAAD